MKILIITVKIIMIKYEIIQRYEITEYNWERKRQIIVDQILILKLVVSVMKFFILWLNLLKKKEEMNSRIISIMIFCANINFIEIECYVYIIWNRK